MIFNFDFLFKKLFKHNQYYLLLQEPNASYHQKWELMVSWYQKTAFLPGYCSNNSLLTYAVLFFFTKGAIFTRFYCTCELNTHCFNSYIGDYFERMTKFDM